MSTRIVLIGLMVAQCAMGQEAVGPAPQSVEGAVVAPVRVDVPPLAPVDMNSSYASPRDAARHRMQSTFAALDVKRDVRTGVRGFGDAVALDSSYAPAVFNLAVLSAIAGRWEDAVAALQEAARLDPQAFGKHAESQLERWRMVGNLERTEQGKRRRRYDEALLPILERLPKWSPTEAIGSLAALGEIDPARWEAPALLGVLYADNGGYETGAKFLAIAETNATDPEVKKNLARAKSAAEREVRYGKIRTEADIAADSGEHAKAATLYQQSWAVIPARTDNGMEAASAFLLEGDTVKAAGVLAKLSESGDNSLTQLSQAMLKELQAIEPAARQASPDGRQFFADPGSAQLARIGPLLPQIDRKPLEVLTRPLPKLVRDEEPVVLLASLSTNPAESAQAFLPVLPEPRIAGEQPWREAIGHMRALPAAATASQERPVENAVMTEGRTARTLKVKSVPAGAQLFVNGRADSACRTPCDIRIEGGTHQVKAVLEGYVAQESKAAVHAKGGEIEFALEPARGNVVVDTGAPAALKVNGTAIGTQGPAELALLPGVHRIEADFGGSVRGRVLNVKAGARLRVRLEP